jgi:hypothetical protein
MPDIDAVRKIMMAGFSSAEQNQLKQMLRRMRRNLSPEPVRRPRSKEMADEAAPPAPDRLPARTG